MPVSEQSLLRGPAGDAPEEPGSIRNVARRSHRRDRRGTAFTWLCGGALAVNLVLVGVLVGLLASRGLAYFWQSPLVALTLGDGTQVLGEPFGVEEIPGSPGAMRSRIKTGNRDVTGREFIWIDDADVRERSLPPDVVVLERREWGNFYGTAVELRLGSTSPIRGSRAVLEGFPPAQERALSEFDALRSLERDDLGYLNQGFEALRLEERRLDLDGVVGPERIEKLKGLETERAALQQAYDLLNSEVVRRREALRSDLLVVSTIDGQLREIPVADIIRLVPANRLGFGGRLAVYFDRLWEFVSGEPRESNTEGGIFPAIFGTVLMVLVLSVVVAPLGVLAALYLREYAREGLFVQIVRIAVNNLAGVPSIVFGVFGLGFFVYTIGGNIDQLFFPESLPTPTLGTGGILWASLTLALLTVPVVIVATEEGLAAVPRAVREASLALGATRFETIWRVVLPAAAPGLMTGLILAMARAAGEVAPLMIVGMVKLAPALPIDGQFPFVHLERKFMHLGFHIYDVGFQSPNVEAAEPLVFATALLLVLVVSVMNLFAIVVRNRLRARYATSAV